MPKKTPQAKKTRRPRPVKHIRPSAMANSPPQVSPARQWHRPGTWRNRQPVPTYEPLPKARDVCMESLGMLWGHWKLFGGIVIVYGALNMLLVHGLISGAKIAVIKSALIGNAGDIGGQVQGSVATFFYILGSAGGSTSDVAGLYQSLLLVFASLATIWAIRQILAGHLVTVKDSFYKGMYPLVPYLLTYLLLGLQLLPLIIAGYMYSAVLTGGLAVHVLEQFVWAVLCLALGFWSLAMVTSTIFATYIVTLPDMTPMRAYRSARQLVYGRRLLIWRKLIFLPIVLLLAYALILVPVIMIGTSFAPWVLFGLSIVALPITHAYVYNVYRELL